MGTFIQGTKTKATDHGLCEMPGLVNTLHNQPDYITYMYVHVPCVDEKKWKDSFRIVGSF